MAFAIKRGFTLIELVIVMAVIGIMSGTVISVLKPASFKSKANDSRRRTDLTEAQGALEMYYADNYHYPIYSLVPVPLESVAELSDYTTTIPQDPVSGSYYYISNADGSDYELNAEFESQDMTADGGNDSARYEVGTDLTLYSSTVPMHYSCNTSTWSCYEDVGGPYGEAGCTIACTAPPTRWACNSFAGSCYPSSWGAYSTENSCLINCSSTKWACNPSTRKCFPSSTGSFKNSFECEFICSKV